MVKLCVSGKRERRRLGTGCRMSVKWFCLERSFENVECVPSSFTQRNEESHTYTHTHNYKERQEITNKQKRAGTPAPKGPCLEPALGDTLLGFCLPRPFFPLHSLPLAFFFSSNKHYFANVVLFELITLISWWVRTGTNSPNKVFYSSLRLCFIVCVVQQ